MHNTVNLLILAPHYTAFIKDQVEALSSYFDCIYVAIGYNPLVEVSSHLPKNDKIKYFQKYSKKNLSDFTGVPNNVKINFIPTIYFVPDGSNKALGDKIFKNMCQWIDTYNIKIDLIHAHFFWPCGYIGYKLKYKYNIPLIITGHGFDVYDLPFRDLEWNAIIKRVLMGSDHVITVSRGNYDVLMQLDVPADKISIIPNGYDPLLFKHLSKERIREKLNLPNDRKIILSVGNLELIKGHKYLLEALKIILLQERDILCIVVGSGSQERSLKKMINNLELSDHVKLVGSKPHDKIPLWMNASDIFILPSLNEGNPTVMFEALGCGKPFVGTRVGGVPEIIINDKLGILVEPKNPYRMAQAILQAMETEWDEEYIHEYAEQFAWDNIAEQIMHVYESILEKLNSGGRNNDCQKLLEQS